MKLTGIVALASLAFVASAQAADRKPPRDAYGRPSFEGLWTNNTATPLERPASFKGAPTASAEEADAYQKQAMEAFYNNGDPVDARHSEWWEKGWSLLRIDGRLRTSLVVEPPDGRLPFTDHGRRRLAEHSAAVLTGFDGPESRPVSDRCLAGNSGNTGAPLLPANYNNNYQIVQTRDVVAIVSEAMHEARLIELGPPRRAPVEPRRWMGNSVGWFEGQVLVVETAGFNAAEAFRPQVGPYISLEARVTERFTRQSTGQILYDFTVDDPVAYARPWRARSLFTATAGPVFEYACHEGNYALEGMLAGARQAEEAARKAGR